MESHGRIPSIVFLSTISDRRASVSEKIELNKAYERDDSLESGDDVLFYYDVLAAFLP